MQAVKGSYNLNREVILNDAENIETPSAWVKKVEAYITWKEIIVSYLTMFNHI